MSFKEIKLEDLSINPWTMIGKEWWLIGAGNKEHGYNAMSAAWGTMGSVWDRPTDKGKIIIPLISVYVRPNRYTKQFLDKEQYFTLSSFGMTDRKMFGYMGSKSGRDEDKFKGANLTPYFIEGTTGVEEANMIFVCRKIYNQPFVEESFVDEHIIPDNYPKKDFHVAYYGEIIKVLVKE